MEDQLGKLLRSGPAERPAVRPGQGQGQEEPLLSDQQRRLVESVFRGCDLVLQQREEAVEMEENLPPSPPQTPPPADHTGHPSRRHFHNNAYLDQVLDWAYTPSAEP